jgi:hypothetical protein
VENPGTMLLASWALWDALEQRMLRAQGLVAPEADPFRLPCPLLLVSGGSPRHTAVRSAARQALTASALAPGTDQTLQQLRDPVRRPTNQYPAPAETVQPTRIPHPDPDLPANQLLTNLRRARKGAAPGPSGLTAETLRLVLDDEHTITVACLETSLKRWDSGALWPCKNPTAP